MISRPNFGPLRWHYPDQVVRVFLSLHKEGHPESLRDKNVLSGQVTVSRGTTQAGLARLEERTPI